MHFQPNCPQEVLSGFAISKHNVVTPAVYWEAVGTTSKPMSTKEAIITATQHHIARSQTTRTVKIEHIQKNHYKGTESESSVRLKKPARVVFEDLPTAHSPIMPPLARRKNSGATLDL